MNNLTYVSTRGEDENILASVGILKGIANDGGLYIPKNLPRLDKTLDELVKLNYQDLAYEILKIFFTDFTEEELKSCIRNAYDNKFDTDLIAPVIKVQEDYFLELFHGPTIAFKDMALSILPYLLTTAAKKNNVKEKIVILTATSGDTGMAALEGFKNIKDTSIVVFYPKDGVSKVQKKQMVTIDGNNTYVIGVDGNFDDTQTEVKRIFTNKDINKEFKDKGYIFSSANSINIGRLFPQVVYYFYAYSQMVRGGYIKLGDKINFTVPTGNFGNILAGYYGKMLGLPINKLICASNENKVLYDFLKTGIYDKNRKFILTTSPSMDILISSNFERLIYLLSDSETTKKLFNDLDDKGKYEFNETIEDFYGEYVTIDETKTAIKDVYEKGYVMDTHTGVGYMAYKKYEKDISDGFKNVIVSTASPYKFPEAVTFAIDENNKNVDAFKLFNKLEEYSSVKIPDAVNNLESKTVTQNISCGKDEMEKIIRKLFL